MRTAAARRARRARARAGDPAPTPKRRAERRLRRLVHRLSGCLGTLPTNQRRVLVLRAGAGSGPALSRRAVAQRLNVSSRRVAQVERRGLRRLSTVARASSCDGASAAAPAAGEGGATTVMPGHASAPAPVTSGAGAAAPSSGGSEGSEVVRQGSAAKSGDGVGTPRSAVKDAFISSRLPGVAASSARPWEPPLVLLMVTAFLMAAGIAWRMTGPGGNRRPMA